MGIFNPPNVKKPEPPPPPPPLPTMEKQVKRRSTGRQSTILTNLSGISEPTVNKPTLLGQ